MTETHSWRCQRGEPAQVLAKKPPAAGVAEGPSGVLTTVDRPLPERDSAAAPRAGQEEGRVLQGPSQLGAGGSTKERPLFSPVWKPDRILLSQLTPSRDIPPPYLALQFLRTQTQTQTHTVDAFSSLRQGSQAPEDPVTV